MCVIVPRIGAASPASVSCVRHGRVLFGLRVFVAVVVAALAATAAIAQTTGTATLVGTVTDSTGAVVPGVQVTVVNADTAFRSETTTTSEGSYTVPYLSPGSYQLTAQVAGFKRYVRDGLVIRTAETPRVDIRLEVGSTTESL